MFHSARLKLTAWYLLSIMAISIFFSFAAYRVLTFEMRRGLVIQAMQTIPRQERMRGIEGDFRRAERTLVFPPAREFSLPPHAFDEELFAEGQRRVALNLIILNIGILALSGGTGYFLAGRTLKPIEAMVDEQKRFVADASHELRTPLTALKTEIEVALRDKEFDAASAKNLLNSNLEEIDKLQALSDYLLMLGRYQDTTTKFNFTEVNLADSIGEARQSVQALAQAKNIEIQSDIENIVLNADKESLVKLFVIFLDNAVKYSDENGIIILRAHAARNKAVIAVQDFGAGIRAGDLPHIFNRFYRAEASRSKTNVGGYGLGLSIAKSIIDLHAGSVNVESTPGMGTTFTITLQLKH